MKKIAIFGVPRCGSSWLSQIFNSHPHVAMRFQPLFSYEHKSRLSANSSAGEILDFFNQIHKSRDAFVLMTSDLHKHYPSFSKSSIPTHIAFKETRYLHIIQNILQQCSEIKIIGIVRNPLATLASWMQAPKEFYTEWDIHAEWRKAPSKNQNRPEEFFGFDKWKEVAEHFIQFGSQYPDQFKMLRYEQLNSNPLETATNLFKFCSLQMHPQVLKFIKSSKSVHDASPYSVFRAKANDQQWRYILPEDIVQEIRREMSGTILQTFL